MSTISVVRHEHRVPDPVSQVIVLRGAPGVGKSRTCAELLRCPRHAVVEVDTVWAMIGGPARGSYLTALRLSVDLVRGFVREGCARVVLAAPFDDAALPCALGLLAGLTVSVVALYCADFRIIERLEGRSAWEYTDIGQSLTVNAMMHRVSDALDTTYAKPAEVAARVLRARMTPITLETTTS